MAVVFSDIDKEDLELLNEILNKEADRKGSKAKIKEKMNMRRVLSFSEKLEQARNRGERLGKAEFMAKQRTMSKLRKRALDYEEDKYQQVTNPKNKDPHVKNRSVPASRSNSFLTEIKKAKWRGVKLAEAEFNARHDRLNALERLSKKKSQRG